ncbi:MAG: DNA repair protein RecO [Bacteroides sp.]|nr:DNA repair protein RecO [Roseburia sp.]MCM1345910.1 DNA repair protein RecO [Bacteroides sp.]MCM1421373.1 DNA repair protein RecO [Bacteroides sp.]
MDLLCPQHTRTLTSFHFRHIHHPIIKYPYMLEKFKGIVLRTVKYSDSQMIASIYTNLYGLQSFIVPRTRMRKTSINGTLWQPLNMVEFDCDLRASARLPRPQEACLYYSYTELRFSPLKSSIAIFLAEFLCAVLQREQKNLSLYAYLEYSLQWLDVSSPASAPNFHLVFLLRMLRFIGIMPNTENYHTGMFFNLTEGICTPQQPSHPYFIHPDEAAYIPLLFRMNYDTMHLFRFSRKQRRHILETLNVYYRLHIPAFPELKSLEVLQEVFD